MGTVGPNLGFQPLVIYHYKVEGPNIHRWYLVGIGGHRASGKMRPKKAIFEFFFSKFRKPKNLVL